MIAERSVSRVCILALAMVVASSANATAQTDVSAEPTLLPYPERIQALKPPVNARLRYGEAAERRFVTDIIWGPEKAPGLFRMRAQGAIEISPGERGPVVRLTRGKTEFTLGPKTDPQADDGMIIAGITPAGRFREIELKLPGLDDKVHRVQFGLLGPGLIDTGRIQPFMQKTRRTGPDDTGGTAQYRREKEARADLLEAMQPMLGLILQMPANGLHTGSRLVVLRRDLGDLFRDAGPIPLRVEGTVMGIAEIDNRRFLTLRLDRAEMAPPMRARIEGYALIDLETALPETVVATIELVVLNGAESSVFRFVERRALLPDLSAQ